MPVVGEVEQHPGNSFWRSGSEEKGHRETSTLGKKQSLQVRLFWPVGQEAMVQPWSGGTGVAQLRFGERAGRRQHLFGEEQGRRPGARGAAARQNEGTN
jgi:hypothetical protein